MPELHVAEAADAVDADSPLVAQQSSPPHHQLLQASATEHSAAGATESAIKLHIKSMLKRLRAHLLLQ